MVARFSPAMWAQLLLVLSISFSCQPNGGHSDGKGGGGELVIFAAASLTDVFEAIKHDFEKQHPKATLKLNFAGSQSLRTQIENGAKPLVFASADEAHMEVLRGAKLVDEPVIFARNVLVVVVPTKNPAGIETLADLPKASRLVVAGNNVPVGTYTLEMLAKASRAKGYGTDFAERVTKKVVSRETHVRQTLQKVVLGEADAAVVYATDAKAAGDKVKTIAIPEELNVVATYPIATVAGVARSQLGQRFVDFVRSDAVRARLEEFGFRPPEADK